MRHVKKNLQVSDDIQEALECVREVRATNQVERYLEGINTDIDVSEKQTIKGELLTGIFVNGAQIVLRLGIASTIIAGAMFILEGSCSFMVLFCFLAGGVSHLCAIRSGAHAYC